MDGRTAEGLSIGGGVYWKICSSGRDDCFGDGTSDAYPFVAESPR